MPCGEEVGTNNQKRKRSIQQVMRNIFRDGVTLGNRRIEMTQEAHWRSKMIRRTHGIYNRRKTTGTANYRQQNRPSRKQPSHRTGHMIGEEA